MDRVGATQCRCGTVLPRAVGRPFANPVEPHLAWDRPTKFGLVAIPWRRLLTLGIRNRWRSDALGSVRLPQDEDPRPLAAMPHRFGQRLLGGASELWAVHQPNQPRRHSLCLWWRFGVPNLRLKGEAGSVPHFLSATNRSPQRHFHTAASWRTANASDHEGCTTLKR